MKLELTPLPRSDFVSSANFSSIIAPVVTAEQAAVTAGTWAR